MVKVEQTWTWWPVSCWCWWWFHRSHCWPGWARNSVAYLWPDWQRWAEGSYFLVCNSWWVSRPAGEGWTVDIRVKGQDGSNTIQILSFEVLPHLLIQIFITFIQVLMLKPPLVLYVHVSVELTGKCLVQLEANIIWINISY